jgi:hypothetical protein
MRSIFEDESLLHADPARALATFQRLGVDTVRVYIAWDDIAPDPDSPTVPAFDAVDPAAYPAAAWTLYDTIVRDAAARGIGIDLTVGSPPPLWAADRASMPPTRNCPCHQWMPSARDFGAFMRAVGIRYSGHYVPPGASRPLPRVHFWSIWNEPNYGPYLAPQAVEHSTVEVAPRLYRNLLDAAWAALGATGHGPSTDTVLIGETAPRGIVGERFPGNFSGMVPLRFIRALYCVGEDMKPLRGSAAAARGCPATASGSAGFTAAHPALFQATGFADHPYPDSLPPTVRTAGQPDYADFAALGNLERTLDAAAAAYGSHAHLPIYSTEFGYRTNPPFPGGLAPPLAAAYMNRAEYLSWRDGRIRSYDQYLLQDPPGSQTGFPTGLVYSSGVPKPSLAAYRMPLWLPVTRASHGTALQVWGGVRPAGFVARRTGRAQQVEIEFAATGSQTFRPVKSVTLTDPHGYFDVAVTFPGSGRVRLAWAGSGPHLHSRAQTITLT